MSQINKTRDAGIVTYPEMDGRIVDILRFRGDPTSLYSALRIEELEAETERLLERAQRAEAWSDCRSRLRQLEEAGKPTPTLLEQMTELDAQVADLRGALQAALLPLERAADALVPEARVAEAAGLVDEALVAIREELE